MAAINDAQGRQDAACEAYLDVQDELDALQVEVLRLGKAILKAEQRLRPVDKEKKQLEATKQSIKALRRGPRVRRIVAQLRQVMKLLPELVVRFRKLDPFNGTAAQALQPRELDEYETEELEQGIGGKGGIAGRHRMLKARLRPEASGAVAGDGQEVRRRVHACVRTKCPVLALSALWLRTCARGV
jgi:hypothetical protein